MQKSAARQFTEASAFRPGGRGSGLCACGNALVAVNFERVQLREASVHIFSLSLSASEATVILI